jgi:ABC-2 type transport system permease protein
MVYDREMGSMRTLMVSPMPRWFLLTSKLLAAVLVSVVQVYVYLAIAWFWKIRPPALGPYIGYAALIPALILSGLMLGALGLLMSSLIKQLENFAGVMNFVIFPMFFASAALYPLYQIRRSSLELFYIATYNPFSRAVDLIRFALYGQVNVAALLWVLGFLLLFLALAIYGYDPSRGIIARRGGPGGPPGG